MVIDLEKTMDCRLENWMESRLENWRETGMGTPTAVGSDLGSELQLGSE